MADGLPRADGDAVAAVDAVLFCALFQGVEPAKAGEDACFFAQAAMDRNGMRPTAEDFRSFCHNAGCTVSHKRKVLETT